MSLSDEILELENEEFSLLQKVNNLRSEIEAKRLLLCEEQFGIRVGSIVERNGKQFKVARIEVGKYWLSGRPWVVGNPKNKNGEFGKQERNLYSSWEVAQCSG